MRVKKKKKGHPAPLFLSIFVLISLTPFLPGRQSRENEPADSSRLAAVLKKSAEYCRRLDRASLDFICLEEVTEMTRYLTPHTDLFLYDYQFIRKNRETKEMRNLVSANGKKIDVRESPLYTAAFQYKNVLFGPVGLLSSAWQAYHDFKLAGEESFSKEKVVLVEATPNSFLVTPHPYGKIWIKEEDGSVLKIVWDQRSLGNFQGAEEWAKYHEVELQITALTEFGLEKNGLRFPSRSFSEYAYVDKNKRKFVNAEISIVYKNYKFFTVETEVKY
jgi:hypothetical protein